MLRQRAAKASKTQEIQQLEYQVAAMLANLAVEQEANQRLRCGASGGLLSNRLVTEQRRVLLEAVTELPSSTQQHCLISVQAKERHYILSYRALAGSVCMPYPAWWRSGTLNCRGWKAQTAVVCQQKMLRLSIKMLHSRMSQMKARLVLDPLTVDTCHFHDGSRA